MSRKNVRVIIPRNADELIELGESIVAKHNEDPAVSPLAGLDMAAFEALVTEAKSTNEGLKQLRRNAETATEQRDTLLGHRKDQSTNTLGTMLNFVVRSREILLGSFKGTEQKLGDFGFEVNQSTTSSNGNGGDAGSNTATLDGTIIDSATMNPIAKALIRVSGEEVLLETDNLGRFMATGVPYGTYLFTVSASGYTSKKQEVVVDSPNLGVEIMLNPIAP